MYISTTTGKAVRVLSHADGIVNFVDATKYPDTDNAADMADHEFFAQFREATAEEIEAAAEKAAKRGKSDAPAT